MDNRSLALHRLDQTTHQGRPVDAPAVTDNADARYARTYDDSVTGAACIRARGRDGWRKRIDATHCADLVTQPAADAEATVPECMEHLQRHRLQIVGKTPAADRGQVVDRLVTHAATPIRAQPCIERHRGPVDQAQIADGAIETSAH